MRTLSQWDRDTRTGWLGWLRRWMDSGWDGRRPECRDCGVLDTTQDPTLPALGSLCSPVENGDHPSSVRERPADKGSVHGPSLICTIFGRSRGGTITEMETQAACPCARCPLIWGAVGCSIQTARRWAWGRVLVLDSERTRAEMIVQAQLHPFNLLFMLSH